MSTKNQSGIAHLGILLAILVIAIIGGVGWYVVNKQEEKKITNFEECVSAGNPVMESHPEQCSADGQTFVNTSQQEPADVEKQASIDGYLHIKEWDVKIKLNEAISKGYYYFDPERGEDQYLYAYLSVESLKGTDCAADKTTTGAITRFKEGEKNPISDNTYFEDYPDSPNVGSYYYFFTKPQAMCSEDKAVQETASTAASEFSKALETISAD